MKTEEPVADQPAKSEKEKSTAKKKPKSAAKKPAKKSVKTRPAAEKAAKSELKETAAKKPLTFAQDQKKVTITKKAKKGSFAAIFVAIIVFLFLSAALYQTRQLSQQSKMEVSSIREDVTSEVDSLKSHLQTIADELKQQKLKESEQVFTVYTNDVLGVSFQYPPEMGEVTEEAVASSGEGDDSSEIVTLSFTNNPDIWLILSTENAQSEDPLVYAGGEADLSQLCVDPLAIADRSYCDRIVVSGQSTHSLVFTIGEEEQIDGVVKTVPLNASGPYKGMTINLALGKPPVRGRNLFAPQNASDETVVLEDFLRNLIKREKLSLIVKENLEAFDKIVETIQVK